MVVLYFFVVVGFGIFFAFFFSVFFGFRLVFRVCFASFLWLFCGRLLVSLGGLVGGLRRGLSSGGGLVGNGFFSGSLRLGYFALLNTSFDPLFLPALAGIWI